MFKIQKLKVILVVCILSLVAVPVFGAEIFLDTKIQEIGLNQQFQVDLLLNTENKEINAVEGKVIFPENLLELKEIRDGNSIVNFWIEGPRVESANQIIFSGITPGGYMGETGLIFSVIFQTKNGGEGTIEIHEAKTLLNDGKGTKASITTSNFQLLISKETSLSQIPPTKIIDTNPPESFEPVIGQDPEIFDGKYFLVFLTQDKGSGTDHYEILEKEQKNSIRSLIKKDEWQVGESPYLLKDQRLKSYIYVKAVDRAGNQRIEVVRPSNPQMWYENYWLWVIIIIGILIAILMAKFLWRRKH